MLLSVDHFNSRVINFELHVWAIAERLSALCAARPECKGMGDTLYVWNLRGHNTDLSLLRPKLEEQFARPVALFSPCRARVGEVVAP